MISSDIHIAVTKKVKKTVQIWLKEYTPPPIVKFIFSDTRRNSANSHTKLKKGRYIYR